MIYYVFTLSFYSYLLKCLIQLPLFKVIGIDTLKHSLKVIIIRRLAIVQIIQLSTYTKLPLLWEYFSIILQFAHSINKNNNDIM